MAILSPVQSRFGSLLLDITRSMAGRVGDPLSYSWSQGANGEQTTKSLLPAQWQLSWWWPGCISALPKNLKVGHNSWNFVHRDFGGVVFFWGEMSHCMIYIIHGRSTTNQKSFLISFHWISNCNNICLQLSYVTPQDISKDTAPQKHARKDTAQKYQLVIWHDRKFQETEKIMTS